MGMAASSPDTEKSTFDPGRPLATLRVDESINAADAVGLKTHVDVPVAPHLI